RRCARRTDHRFQLRLRRLSRRWRCNISRQDDRMNLAPSAASANPLVYPCGEPPPAGQTREIAPGVVWIRMPMPFRLDHVNLWAVRDDDGWAIMDTGLQTLDTATAWRSMLASSAPLGNG